MHAKDSRDELIDRAVSELVAHDASPGHVAAILARVREADSPNRRTAPRVRLQWSIRSSLAAVAAVLVLAAAVSLLRAPRERAMPASTPAAAGSLAPSAADATRDEPGPPARVDTMPRLVAEVGSPPNRRPVSSHARRQRASAGTRDGDNRLEAYLAALRQLPPEVLLATASGDAATIDVVPLSVPELAVEPLETDGGSQDEAAPDESMR
jgi:hypothetical protein